MKCKLCNTEILTKENIKWLDDIIVCLECYNKETTKYDELEME